MALNNIWVFAQLANGAPTSATLELLSKARSLSSNVVAFLGADGGNAAAALGEFGATKVYATGDLGGALPGVAVSGAMMPSSTAARHPTSSCSRRTTRAATSWRVSR